MRIITISRGSYSRGKEVAERVAEELGYECVSREVLLSASDQYDVPEVKLARAIHDAPTILERLGKGKEHYVAFIRAALLSRVKNGDVVYHGLAGHFFLQSISHVLKVRVIADIDARVEEEIRRERIERAEAEHLLRRDDEERRKWGLFLYDSDTSDPHLYDMTVHVDTLSVAEAAHLIVEASRLPSFRPTPASTRALEELCTAAMVEAALLDAHVAVIDVQVRDGVSIIRAHGTIATTARLSQEVARVAHSVPGVGEVKVEVVPDG